MMDRRCVVQALALAAVARLAGAQAPVAGRVYRIGYLGFTAANTPDDEVVWRAFVQRLRELGYSEGANLVIERRYAEGRNERYTEFAAEMVKLGADIVVVTSGSAARAVMAASRTMPIVTTGVPDPLRAGLIASFARPGGQLTGISNFSQELTPKRLQLLKEAVPSATRIAFARCPQCNLTAGMGAAEISAQYADEEAAARSLGVKWLPLDVNAAADFDGAAAAVRRERADALLIGATQVNVALRPRWLAFAAEQRLPTMAPARQFGAMLSYGPSNPAIFRRAAEFVAKILGGENPGALPMEQPTRFEFVVNLKMAKALGLTIPYTAMLLATDVIE